VLFSGKNIASLGLKTLLLCAWKGRYNNNKNFSSVVVLADKLSSTENECYS